MFIIPVRRWGAEGSFRPVQHTFTTLHSLPCEDPVDPDGRLFRGLAGSRHDCRCLKVNGPAVSRSGMSQTRCAAILFDQLDGDHEESVTGPDAIEVILRALKNLDGLFTVPVST